MFIGSASTPRTHSASAAAGSSLANDSSASGSRASGYAMPPRNRSTRNSPLAAARLASARSVPAMSMPMPAKATVPMSSSPSAGRMPALASQPSAMPTPMISTDCSTSIASTFAVFAVSRPVRESGVEPRRLSTP